MNVSRFIDAVRLAAAVILHGYCGSSVLLIS